jgi:hypothetical protein
MLVPVRMLQQAGLLCWKLSVDWLALLALLGCLQDASPQAVRQQLAQ